MERNKKATKLVELASYICKAASLERCMSNGEAFTCRSICNVKNSPGPCCIFCKELNACPVNNTS